MAELVNMLNGGPNGPLFESRRGHFFFHIIKPWWPSGLES
jgi:hypothetical protein